MIRACALFATTMMTAVLSAAPEAHAAPEAQAAPRAHAALGDQATLGDQAAPRAQAALGDQAAPGAQAALRDQAARRSQGADLELAYLADAGYAVAVRLFCDPPGGGHPQPARACATLARADGMPGRIKGNPAMYCTMQYDPITAEITGTWRGRQIDWKQRYGNKCEMIRATGVLFTF